MSFQIIPMFIVDGYKLVSGPHPCNDELNNRQINEKLEREKKDSITH